MICKGSTGLVLPIIFESHHANSAAELVDRSFDILAPRGKGLQCVCLLACLSGAYLLPDLSPFLCVTAGARACMRMSLWRMCL